jgi:hypothetical protein
MIRVISVNQHPIFGGDKMRAGAQPWMKIRRPWSAVRRHFQGRFHERQHTTTNEISPSVVRRPPSFSREIYE